MRSGKKVVGGKKVAAKAVSKEVTAGKNAAEAEITATGGNSAENEVTATVGISAENEIMTDRHAASANSSDGDMSGGDVSAGDVSLGDASVGDDAAAGGVSGGVSGDNTSDSSVSASIPTTESTAAERSARISSIADSIVDKLSSAIDELDATDTQKLRHVVSALKEIKDLQSLSLGDEVTERALRLRELRSKVTSAESDAAPSIREVTVHIDGDDGYSD